MTVVIDASAVLELWLSPAGTQLAARVQGESLHAPTHIGVEATNVVRRQHVAGVLSDDAAQTAFDGIMRSPLQLWPFETLAARVRELSANATTYDAAYIALAERLNVPLVTHDAKLDRIRGVQCAVEVY